MHASRVIPCIWATACMLGWASQPSAQSYANRPIRLLANGIGGASDIMARLIVADLGAYLGQQVVVDPRPGGVIPGDVVSKSAADGYTLLLTGSNMWLASLLQRIPYDPLRDFAPITLLAIAPNILVVHPSLPAKSVRELIALAKARPGELFYSAAATGSSSHLAAALFTYMARVDIVHVPYKGGTGQMADLLGGQVQVSFATAGSSAPHIKSGRLRALAVTTAKPSPLLPDLPTIAQAGVPGYESVAVTGMFAPGQTPTAIVHRLNQETLRALSKPDVREKFANIGVEPVGSSEDELSTKMKSELARMQVVFKNAGIRADN